MKIISYCNLLILAILPVAIHAQKLTNEHTNEFASSKLSYINSCVHTYEESEQICDCTFEYMRNNYKVRFYQDDAFLNDTHQHRQHVLEKMTESLQVCSAIERDEFAYPRTFD